MTKKNYKDINMDVVENKDNIIFVLYGTVAAILFFFIFYCLISFNVFSVWSWEIGFIDPSTAFAISLIRLYNFIWSFLVLVLVIVFILMTRIIYLFNWNLNIEKNFILNKILVFFLNILLSFGFFVNDKSIISKSLLRLNELKTRPNLLNNWYSNYPKNEFLVISDLSEYKKLEFVWCVLPAIVLCLIAGPSFSLVFSLDSSVNPDITIHVLGRQWYWVYSFDCVLDVDNNEMINKNFNYDSVMMSEDDLQIGTHRLLEVDNRLLIPVGIPIRFLITASDVLHSWAVPSLGLKVDAVPGRLNQFIVEIKKPGVFYGQCSDYVV